jgi:hypothetical protein
MKFSSEKPPIFDRLHKTFGVEWGGSLVIAYDGTIYHSQPLDPSVIAHENVHLVRQKDNVVQWWEHYIRDKDFRFTEELLAYHAQYDFLKQVVIDRNELARHLFRLSKDLAGPMYGSIVSQAEARRLISMK